MSDADVPTAQHAADDSFGTEGRRLLDRAGREGASRVRGCDPLGAHASLGRPLAAELVRDLFHLGAVASRFGVRERAPCIEASAPDQDEQHADGDPAPQ